MPDPGRRLSNEEQATGKEKPAAKSQSGPFDPSPQRPRNDKACEGARKNYQFSCQRGSPFSSNQSCAEAYAIYKQSCP